jgi:hypothetical protein
MWLTIRAVFTVPLRTLTASSLDACVANSHMATDDFSEVQRQLEAAAQN